MGKNLFCCIKQRRKISSIVRYYGRKPVSLWDTMQKIILPCIPQFFCVVFITKKKLFFGVGYSAEKASVKWDTVHCISFCCGVGYNGRKIPELWDPMEKNLSAIQRLFSVVSHNRKKPLPLCSTTKENLLRCIPQWKKTLPLYFAMEKYLFRCIQKRPKNVKLKKLHNNTFFSKMTLTHESGSQVDQFDEKNGGQKYCGTITLTVLQDPGLIRPKLTKLVTVLGTVMRFCFKDEKFW
jgi:hypothetical protein